MLGGEAGSTSCFILPDQEQVYFSFWAYNTATIQFPCQTYLTHICCMPIRLWVRRVPKVQPSVNVTIPVSECCSAWMLLWFLGWGESDSPEKRTIYAVTRWLARQVGQRETCSAWKNGIFSDRTGSRADLQESFNLRGAFWVDGKFRDFLDPTQTCSKLGAWDLWPFLRKTQRICGESGTQEFRAGGERILTDIMDLQLQTMFSGSQLWRCPGLLSQWKNKESLKSSWVMGFNYKKHMYRTRQNSAFDQPERWFCGMLFLGQELAWGLGCQFPNIFGLSFPVSRSVMFFQLWWVLKLQSQNFLENWQLLMWIEHPKGFPKSEMRTCRKTHLGKTWFNPMGNPQFFTFKDLKFGTTSHSTVMGKAFSSCWQALALPWSWSVWHPGTMLCAW